MNNMGLGLSVPVQQSSQNSKIHTEVIKGSILNIQDGCFLLDNSPGDTNEKSQNEDTEHVKLQNESWVAKNVEDR